MFSDRSEKLRLCVEKRAENESAAFKASKSNARSQSRSKGYVTATAARKSRDGQSCDSSFGNEKAYIGSADGGREGDTDGDGSGRDGGGGKGDGKEGGVARVGRRGGRRWRASAP